jgi:AmpD protein
VYQLLPFNLKGWHAGVSSYDGEPNVNEFSIGIENVGTGKSWPEAQVEANRAIILALCNAYNIEDVVGHEDVAPGRKTDPGPLYPWDEVTTIEE